MKRLIFFILVCALLLFYPSACAIAPTPTPPTATPIPPTATPLNPTDSALALLVYPNATLDENVSENVTVYVTSDPFEQVADFYQNNLSALHDAGWVDGILGGLLVQCDASTCAALAALDKDDQEIQVLIKEKEDKTVSITLGIK